MEQDKRHIPQSSASPHNLHTRPADNQEVDKLRENPHNDEKIITQQERSQDSNPDLRSGSTFAEKDENMNRVTNEEEQNRVVNPVVNSLDKKGDGDGDDDDDDDDEKNPEADPDLPSKPEIPAEPDYPTENPYEQIGDDPDEMRKKIPTM
jgi:hypothetical protein